MQLAGCSTASMNRKQQTTHSFSASLTMEPFRRDRAGIDMGSNEPLRGGGVTCWEGGSACCRIWQVFPGVIPAGSVVDQPLWSPDLLVTYAKLTGADNCRGHKTRRKGCDLPVLWQESRSSQHQSFYFEFRKHAALRLGRLEDRENQT